MKNSPKDLKEKLEELKEGLKEIIESPEEEIDKLVNLLKRIKGIVTVKSDGEIEFIDPSMKAKDKVLLVFLVHYILYRVNYLAERFNIPLINEWYVPRIHEKVVTFNELLQKTKMKKGTLGAILTELKEQGIIERVDKAKYELKDPSKALQHLGAKI